MEKADTTEGTITSNYNIDPKKESVSEEYVVRDADGTPDLDPSPAEFEEGNSGVIVLSEEDRNKAIAAESVQKKLEVTRYKKILVSLGFVLQEVREEGKVQYTWEDGEVKIGRTFTEGTPTGRFWARKDGGFLDLPVVKDFAVVKEFYAVRDGKKDIKDIAKKTAFEMIAEPAVTVKQMQEKVSGGNVVAYEKPPRIVRNVGTVKLEKKGGYYNVGGHKEADAWLVQQWGAEAGVTLRIIYAEQDDDSAKAVVRAQLGDLFVEAAVIHHFNTTREVITFETIDIMERRHKKPIVGIDSEGHPLLSSETMYEIYKRLIRFKNFSVRDAVTKASRIATLKILNQDWRSDEEIEAEVTEVRAVNAD